MSTAMRWSRVLVLSSGCLTVAVSAAAQGTRLLRNPTVSRDQVAFAYAGDIWIVPRAGGSARRLTSTASVEAEPRFSPDGTLIAYSATIGGNMDVYVVPALGGEPTRLTYHPGPDAVRGWMPDGKRLIFGSGRTSAPTAYFKLWTIGLDGGLPEPLPMPRAFIVNEFYRLDGLKFSTSRRHAIWAKDALAEVGSDILRYHVLSDRPNGRQTSFTGADLAGSRRLLDRQQRHRSDVGRQHRVFPVGPQLDSELVLVASRIEDRHPAHASRRLRHHERLGRARRDRVRAGRLHPPRRSQGRPVAPARHRRQR